MSHPLKTKTDLVPYSEQYSTLVRSWLDTPKTYQDVCRGKDFPPPEDIVDNWQRQDTESFLLFADNKPVAYGELWHRPVEMASEIMHLLVSPYDRGKGYGTHMTEMLFQRAAQRGNLVKVLINVYGDNREALGCYVKAGFELLGTTTHLTGLRLVKLVE